MIVVLLIWMFTSYPVNAHALDPGYLDLRQVTETSWNVVWRKPDVKGRPMTIDAELPETCSPSSSPQAQADGKAWLTNWIADCPGGLAGGTIRITGLEHQDTDVLIRIQPLAQSARTVVLTPKQTSHVIPAQPATLSVLANYSKLGFEHILEGWDHLLFVFALLVLIRAPWRLVGAITAFTVAHSITLALAALGHLSIPGPPVEAIIALSIVFLALEILKRDESSMRFSERHPWIICFCFGLLHGLGFAGALTEIGLPESDIPAALLAFNIGVEAGQLAFVAGVLLTGALLRVAAPALLAILRKPNMAGSTALGYAIGGVSTFWLAERLSGF